MFNPLKAFGDIKNMRDQAAKMQQALAREEVVVEKNGVKVVMTADMKIKQIVIDGQEENRLKDALSEALRRAQEIAARKLTEMTGGLQGLLGGK